MKFTLLCILPYFVYTYHSEPWFRNHLIRSQSIKHVHRWMNSYPHDHGPEKERRKKQRKETLDTKNLKFLEQIFYMKNQRYSPYIKKHYVNYTSPSPNGSIERIRVEMISPTLINKSWITYLYKQLHEQRLIPPSHEYEYEEEDKTPPDIQEFQQLLDSLLNGTTSTTGKSPSKEPIEFMFPYRESSSSSSSSTRTHRKYVQKHKQHEFETGSQFQIIKNNSFTFHDIGGYTSVKTELLQIADILRHYEKYQKFNVRTPKGIIFEGPPGNGKTLMAKCFCGELNVSFIPVTGSEFTEKYVGVGASRIRELFQIANEHSPCIIFIDEIDALARSRGNDLVSSNSEKDQTLNQLLTSLDGFRENHGIFVIGATNRIDLLDPALLRPGRMDKQIFIGNPDEETRQAIIHIHKQGKPMSSEITMDELVEMTGGFSGAQIENLLNEAMLRALRENREEIIRHDLEDIFHRVLTGWKTTESKFTIDILDRIIIHEIGHAIVGLFSKEHAKLKKVCLNLWSPQTPGYTLFESKDENANIYTKIGLMEHLMILLSGRIAEEVFFGYSVTTGARKDFEEAYHLAQNMILKYGFGKKTIYPELSDMSKYIIDQEISELILQAQENALIIINDCHELMLECSKLLQATNVLVPDQILELMNTKYPTLMDNYLEHKYQICS